MTNFFHKPLFKAILCWLLFGVVWAQLSLIALAQETTTGFSVIHHRLIDTGESINVRVYVHANQAIKARDITLDDVPLTAAAQDLQPLAEEPFYLTILYDASGSMIPAAAAMKAQAEAILADLPENTQISIYRFNDAVDLEYAFAPKGEQHDALLTAVAGLRPEQDVTCLYDALSHVLTAAEQVAANTPRRAILLLSDGRDEKWHGLGDRCSVKSEIDVISQAQNANPPLPLYIVGLKGGKPVNETTLRNLAVATNGYFAMSDSAPVTHALLNYFVKQWLLELTLLPAAGDHTVNMIFDGGTQALAYPLIFTAAHNYQPAVIVDESSPLEVSIQEFAYNPQTNNFDLRVSFSDPVVASTQRWLVRIDDLNFDSSIIITPTFPIEHPVIINQTQPQNLSIINPIRGYPQPSHTYRASLLPAVSLPADLAVITDNALATWVAPPAPAVLIESQVRGLRPQMLYITYTINYPQFVSSIEGFVWGGDLPNPQPFILPISTTSQINATEVITPINLGSNFGTYTVTTYFRHPDGGFLTAQPQPYVIDNRLWTRFTGWLFSLVSQDLMLPTLGLLALLLIGWAAVVTARIRQRRPLPAPPQPAMESTTGPQFAFRVIKSPDATHAGQPILVDDEVFVIGREGCNFNLPGDRQISRRHATIEYKNDGIYITDLDSRNGTFVQGERLTPHERHRLHKNAEVQLGSYTLLRFT